MLDRFGYIDDDTYNYMYEKLFKNLAKNYNFNDITINESNVIVLTMSKEASQNVKGDLWFKTLTLHKNLILKYIHPNIILQTRKESSLLEAMKDIINYLTDIKNKVEK